MIMGAFNVEKRGGVAIITFDMPGEAINKFSADVKEELLQLFENLREDPSVAALAFLSGKPDVFIAGADIEELAALRSKEEARQLSREGQEMVGRVASSPKPVVMGIHGACLGGGLEFALAAHYRVAADQVRIALVGKRGDDRVCRQPRRISG